MNKFFSDLGIYSADVYHDMLARKRPNTSEDESDLLRDYFSYIAVEEAFNGLFVEKSPRELIEGYHDKSLEEQGKLLDFYQDSEIETESFVQLGGREKVYPAGGA